MVSAVAVESKDEGLCCLLAARAVQLLSFMLADTSNTPSIEDDSGRNSSAGETKLILAVNKALQSMVWKVSHFKAV